MRQGRPAGPSPLKAPSELVGTAQRAESYTAATTGRSGWLAWLRLLWAFPRLVGMVFSCGMLLAAAGAAVPVVFAHILERLSSPAAGADASLRNAVLLAAALVLITAVLVVIKERYELALVLGVTQTAYRVMFAAMLRVIPGADESRPPDRGRLTTQPSQVGQFAYVVDFVVSTVQALTLAAVILVQFHVPGLVSLVAICAVVAVSARLVHAIGERYAQYLDRERERVDLIHETARAGHRLRCNLIGAAAQRAAARVRGAEERILRSRGRLQVANGCLECCAVVAMVAVAVVAADLLGLRLPASLLALLVAARLLFSVVQNNLVNYRVIRLTVPVLRALDELRAAADSAPGGPLPDLLGSSPRPVGLALVEPHRQSMDDAMLRRWTRDVIAAGISIGTVPRDPLVPDAVARAVVNGSYSGQVHDIAEALGLGPVMHRVEEESFWDSLSNGERHRMAIALALASEPRVLIVEDVLASLDPISAGHVVSLLARQARTLVVMRSHASAAAHAARYRLTVDGPSVRLLEVEPSNDRALWPTRPVGSQASGGPDLQAAGDGSGRLPDPDPARDQVSTGDDLPMPHPQPRDAVRITLALLGRLGTAGLVGGAALVAASGLGFAVFASELQPSAVPAAASLTALGCLVAMVVGCLIYFVCQYLTPISRLSSLHGDLMARMVDIGGPRAAGALTGRIGSDFSELQMQVPGRLGAVILVVAEVGGVVALLIFRSPLTAAGLLLVLPFAVVLYRRGNAALLATTMDVSRARGAVFGFADLAVANIAVSGSQHLMTQAAEEFRKLADRHQQATWMLFGAMVTRRAQMEGLSAAIVLAALAATFLPTGSVTAGAVGLAVYFAYTVSSRLASVLETMQGAGLATATALRVTTLLAYEPPVAPPHSTETSRRLTAELRQALAATDVTLIRLTGRSGVGKSLALAQLADAGQGRVTVLGSDVPVRGLLVADLTDAPARASDGDGETDGRRVESLSPAARQELMLRAAALTTAPVVVLDETTNALDVEAERASLEHLRQVLSVKQAKAVCVIHRDNNASMFDAVIHAE